MVYGVEGCCLIEEQIAYLIDTVVRVSYQIELDVMD